MQQCVFFRGNVADSGAELDIRLGHHNCLYLMSPPSFNPEQVVRVVSEKEHCQQEMAHALKNDDRERAALPSKKWKRILLQAGE